MTKSQNNFKSYMKLIPAGNMALEHSVLLSEKENLPMLCSVYRFKNLGAFLYFELFNGLQTGYLPKRCNNCGKYSYFSDYCERKAHGETYKTCREIGSRKKFDEKVKSDPIWLTYQHAYKAHYARYMKRK